MAFTSWSITPSMYNFIVSELPEGSSILELGSGSGTEELSKKFKVYSIEDNIDWLNKYKSTYMHVPLTDVYTKEAFPVQFDKLGDSASFWWNGKLQWYNPKVLKEELERVKPVYDMLIIDGPHSCRAGILSYLHLFNMEVPIILDDLDCELHMLMAEEIAKITKRKLEVYTEVYSIDSNIKMWGVIK